MPNQKEKITPKIQEVVIRFGCIFVTGEPQMAETHLSKFFHDTFNAHYRHDGISTTLEGFEKINEKEVDDQTTSFIPNNLWFDVDSPCQESARIKLKDTLTSDQFVSLAARHNIEIDWFDFDFDFDFN